MTWFALLGVAVVVLLRWKRIGASAFPLQAASVAAYLSGLLLWLFALPITVPLRTALSMHWATIDMAQFAVFGRQIALVALILCASGVWLRSMQPGVAAQRVVIAILAVNAAFSMWGVKPANDLRERPEERGDDPVVPVLARIDPRSSIIAADVFNWNEENPHWAAFFGHQFFCLRRGRWTTAYRDYGTRLQEQKVIFETADASAALAIVRARRITHLIEDRSRPIPWLASRSPTFETEKFRLFDFVTTPTVD